MNETDSGEAIVHNITKTHGGLRTALRGLSAAGVCVGAIALSPGAAHASSQVISTVVINGRAVSRSSESNPIKLDPKHPNEISITVSNRGSNTVNVGAVALLGRALDITFFDSETQIALQVAPGASASQDFSINLAALNGEGDGLIPASVRLMDDNGAVLATQSFTADVRGKITSVFGLFVVELAIATGLLLAGALLALARGRLAENRFRRGLRFLWPGIGVGLLITFGLAVIRVFVPRPSRWAPITIICALIGFAVGYLTPTPQIPEEEYDPDLDYEDDEGYDPRFESGRTTIPSNPTP